MNVMSPEHMLVYGWCDDCDRDVSDCILKGVCTWEEELDDTDQESE